MNCDRGFYCQYNVGRCERGCASDKECPGELKCDAERHRCVECAAEKDCTAVYGGAASCVGGICRNSCDEDGVCPGPGQV